jgi:hypothetical protein
MATYLSSVSQPVAIMGKLVAAFDAMLHRLFDVAPPKAALIMTRRQHLAAVVDAARRTRRR